MPGRGPKPKNMAQVGSLPVDYLVPPDTLTDSMREAWNVIVTDLNESGMLDKTDRILIESASVMWGRARDARVIVNEQGYQIPTSRGGTQSNPMITVEREAWKELRLISEHLPLSRIARHRLGLASGPEKKSLREAAEDLGSGRLRAVH